MKSFAIGTAAVALAVVVAACSLANAPGDPVKATGTTTGTGGSAPACVDPGTLCGEACIDLKNNRLNCGKCGKACPTGQMCVAGACALGCAGTTKVCGDKCVDFKVDPANCGDCGKACPMAMGAAPICVASACDISCKPPMRDCNKDKKDGCEIDTSMSDAHCGACGNVCPATAANALPKCLMGTCQKNCAMGFDDCDSDISNGCEAELAKDAKNCGKCGNVCNKANNEVCSKGMCVAQPFNWTIVEQKDIVYNGIPYLLLKLKYNSNTSLSANWCQEYTNLCTFFGYKPTGCDGPIYGGPYLTCTIQYQSNGQGNTLGCNPSYGVAQAALQNGYNDATTLNSFGFHVCDPGSCQKTMCSGNNCNGSLSYFDFAQPVGYTLCRK